MSFFKKLIKKIETQDKSILKDLRKIVKENKYSKDILFEIIYMLIYHKKIKKKDLYKVFDGHEILKDSLYKAMYIDCFDEIVEDFPKPTIYEIMHEWKELVKFQDKRVKIELKSDSINVVFDSKENSNVKIYAIFLINGGMSESFLGASKKYVRDKNLKNNKIRDITNLCLVSKIGKKNIVTIPHAVLISSITLLIKDNDDKVVQIQMLWGKMFETTKKVVDERRLANKSRYKALADYRKKMQKNGDNVYSD